MLIRIFLLGNAIHGTSYTLSPLFKLSRLIPFLPFPFTGEEKTEIFCAKLCFIQLYFVVCLFVCFKLRNCKALWSKTNQWSIIHKHFHPSAQLRNVLVSPWNLKVWNDWTGGRELSNGVGSCCNIPTLRTPGWYWVLHRLRFTWALLLLQKTWKNTCSQECFSFIPFTWIPSDMQLETLTKNK